MTVEINIFWTIVLITFMANYIHMRTRNFRHKEIENAVDSDGRITVNISCAIIYIVIWSAYLFTLNYLVG